MSPVIRKKAESSADDLLNSLDHFMELLATQDEEAAIAALREARDTIQTSAPGSEKFNESVLAVIDAFDGEHELNAYTLHKSEAGGEWSIAEELYLASVQVLNHANRFVRR